MDIEAMEQECDAIGGKHMGCRVQEKCMVGRSGITWICMGDGESEEFEDVGTAKISVLLCSQAGLKGEHGSYIGLLNCLISSSSLNLISCEIYSSSICFSLIQLFLVLKNYEILFCCGYGCFV